MTGAVQNAVQNKEKATPKTSMPDSWCMARPSASTPALGAVPGVEDGTARPGAGGRSRY